MYLRHSTQSLFLILLLFKVIYAEDLNYKLITLNTASYYSESMESFGTHYIKLPYQKNISNQYVTLSLDSIIWMRIHSLPVGQKVTNLDNLDEVTTFSSNFITLYNGTRRIQIIGGSNQDVYLEIWNLLGNNNYDLSYSYDEKKVIPLSILGLTIPILGYAEAEQTEYVAKTIFNLKKTGQEKSFRGGYEVTELDGVKDDGYYQTGIDPKYKKTKNTVIDEITGLEWQNNKEVKSKKNISWIDWVAKDYRDWTGTIGDTPINYCKNLLLDGHSDWRLPSIQELQTLFFSRSDYRVGQTHYGIDTRYFQKANDCLWSSTTLIQWKKHNVWSFHEPSGNSGTSSVQGNPCKIRCVRGNKYASKGYSVGEDTVYDRNTKLEWQDTPLLIPNRRENFNEIYKDLNEAIEICENLILDDKDDWRLPNIIELTSIMDPVSDGLLINDAFSYTYDVIDYISSTGFYDEEGRSYVYKTVRFGHNNARVEESWQTGGGAVRCVRGGKKSIIVK